MKTKNYSIILCVVIFIFVFCLSFFSYILDRHGMQLQFIEQSDFNTLEIKKGDSKLLANKIISYLNGLDFDLQIYLNSYSGQKTLFSQKDLRHMKDVRNIVLFMQFISIFCFYCIIYLIKKIKNSAFYLKSYLICLAITIALVIIIALFGYFNFKASFIFLHKILFTNNDWLLKPGTDAMISLMPLSFFITAAKRILFTNIALLVISNICILLYFHKPTKTNTY